MHFKERMGLFSKILAICLLPLSILIILETLKVWSLALPFTPLFWGAILMIVLQVWTLIGVSIHFKKLPFMNLLTGLVFIIPAGIALAIAYTPEHLHPYIAIIVGIMMFTESMYGLH